MEDLLTQVSRLQAILATAGGALTVALVVIGYLFRELRKIERDRLEDAKLERKSQEEQNKVLQRTIDVLGQINRAIPPEGR